MGPKAAAREHRNVLSSTQVFDGLADIIRSPRKREIPYMPNEDWTKAIQSRFSEYEVS